MDGKTGGNPGKGKEGAKRGISAVFAVILNFSVRCARMAGELRKLLLYPPELRGRWTSGRDREQV
jgi:hypothetical protein